MTIRQEPDLVITQGCDICAPVRTEVDHSFEGAQVLALRPQSLSDVIENIGQWGAPSAASRSRTATGGVAGPHRAGPEGDGNERT